MYSDAKNNKIADIFINYDIYFQENFIFLFNEPLIPWKVIQLIDLYFAWRSSKLMNYFYNGDKNQYSDRVGILGYLLRIAGIV